MGDVASDHEHHRREEDVDARRKLGVTTPFSIIMVVVRVAATSSAEVVALVSIAPAADVRLLAMRVLALVTRSRRVRDAE